MSLRRQLGAPPLFSVITRNSSPGTLKDPSADDAGKPLLTEDIHWAMSQYVQTHQAATWPQVSPGFQPSPSAKMGIKVNGKILFIDPTELISVQAEGNYVLLQKHAGSYFLRATISEMLTKLERYGFIRIHRSLLVNKLFVEELQPYPAGNYGLRVRGGKVFTVSRTYKKNLKSLADSWIGTDTFVSD